MTEAMGTLGLEDVNMEEKFDVIGLGSAFAMRFPKQGLKKF